MADIEEVAYCDLELKPFELAQLSGAEFFRYYQIRADRARRDAQRRAGPTQSDVREQFRAAGLTIY